MASLPPEVFFKKRLDTHLSGMLYIQEILSQRTGDGTSWFSGFLPALRGSLRFTESQRTPQSLASLKKKPSVLFWHHSMAAAGFYATVVGKLHLSRALWEHHPVVAMSCSRRGPLNNESTWVGVVEVIVFLASEPEAWDQWDFPVFRSFQMWSWVWGNSDAMLALRGRN